MAKAPTSIPVFYFDSCLFLALVNEEPNRFKVIEVLLENAEKQECEIWTSQLSIVEVAFGEQEKKGKALSKATESKISKLWHPSSPVRIVDVHSLITLAAKDLIRNAMKQGWTKGEDWSIKPPDAIHLATAKLAKATYFFSYDVRLLKLKTCGVDIREPFLQQGMLGVP
jgi:predicted nucleic acid-binding protein